MTILPRVFIGSSTEGLPVARAVFARMLKETVPTLWDRNVFVPGDYIFEVLERELQRNEFAILVASPDDELLKRERVSKVMRDNLLVEFGLFAGRLGRRRAFFVCPDEPRLELPSDVLGMITATYSAKRAAEGGAQLAASIETACQQVLNGIGIEWEGKQRRDMAVAGRLHASEKVKSIQRLQTAATSVRDALIALQRDALSALADEASFVGAKGNANSEIERITQNLMPDAELINAAEELKKLRDRTAIAISELPFPQELASPVVGRRAVDLGRSALNAFLSGGDALGDVRRRTADETGTILTALCRRYSIWWDSHSPKLQEATAQLQDALYLAYYAAVMQSIAVDGGE